MKPDPELHSNAAKTEERSYDRLRESGIPSDNARKIARDAARNTHETLDRRK